MLARFNFALLRGCIIAAFVLFFSALIEQGGSAEGDLFYLVFGLAAGLLVFIEYSFETPSVTEFRFAPPYNRLRLIIAFVVAFFLSLGAFENVLPGFQHSAILPNSSFDALPSPIYFIKEGLALDAGVPNEWLFEAIASAAFFGAILTLIAAAVLWISIWPLRPQGFNLWENMPNFHTRSGFKASDQLMADAIFNFAFFLVLPYSIAFIGYLMREYLSFDFASSPILTFWFLFLFITVPLFALFKALALVKICILAEKLRKSNHV